MNRPRAAETAEALAHRKVTPMSKSNVVTNEKHVNAKAVIRVVDAANQNGAQWSVSQDISVFSIWQLDGSSLPDEIELAVSGPLANSPRARRLQILLAEAVDGGAPGFAIMDVLCDWARHVERQLLPSRKDTKMLTSAIALAEQSSSTSSKKCVRAMGDLLEELGTTQGLEIDTPAVGTAMVLLEAAMNFEAGRDVGGEFGWMVGARILGAFSLLVPASRLDDWMKTFAASAYIHLFNGKSWAV
jgi:hypothetical protein